MNELRKELDKINNEYNKLNNNKILEYERECIKEKESFLLKETAKLCLEKQRKYKDKEWESQDKLKEKLLSIEKKYFDLNLNKSKIESEAENMS